MHDLGETLNDICNLVESTIVEPLLASTEQVFAALDQIFENAQEHRRSLQAVLDVIARESGMH